MCWRKQKAMLFPRGESIAISLAWIGVYMKCTLDSIFVDLVRLDDLFFRVLGGRCEEQDF
jgi:hypothetical protein